MYFNHDNSPLPYGWIKEIHYESGHPYYVDTKATPPRSVWVHPFDDEQYLREHPDLHKYLQGGGSSLGVNINNKDSQRHSHKGYGNSSWTSLYPSTSQEQSKLVILGKLKDKVIGTKKARQGDKRYNDELLDGLGDHGGDDLDGSGDIGGGDFSGLF